MSRKKTKTKATRPTARAETQDLHLLSPQAPGWQRVDVLWLAAALGLAALVYLLTMWPSIAGGDSGELTAAACTLGIIHPPGYPLYTLLGWIFSQIPFGTVGWRLNLFSTFCGLGALFFTFLSLRRLTHQAWLAFSVTGILAFSPLMWRYSIAAEVFALNNLFATALIYGLIRTVQDQKSNLIYLLSFVFGLGLSNHHTLLFVGTPIGLFLLWTFRSRVLKPWPFLLIVTLFFAGMSPYAYLFWASSRVPLVAWGDITSWSGFMTHLLRKEYGTFNLATQGSNQFQLFWGLFYYLLNLGQTLGYLGLLAVAVGVWGLFKKKTHFPVPGGRLWLVLPFLYLVVFHSLANLPFVSGAALYKDIVSRFWLMPNLVFTFIGAMGLLVIFERVTPSQFKALKGVLLLSPLIALGVHFSSENHRDNNTFSRFGHYLLDELPANAVFFSLGDINTNTIRYLQNCEGYRTDVKVMDRSLMSYPWFKRIVSKHYPDVTLPGEAYHPKSRGSYDFKRLFDANFSKHQIYMTTVKTKDSNEAVDKAWEEHYQLIPYGLVLKVHLKNDNIPMDQYIQETAQFLVDPMKEFPRKPLPDSWDAVIQANYWLAHHTRAAEILRYGLKIQDKKYLKIAEELLEKLVLENPHPPADYFKNLGIAHQHLGRLSEGPERKRHETRMLEVWEVFVQKTDRRDKTYEDIRSVLKAYGKAA